MNLIVLTFGGRECSLQILFPLILKYKKYITEYRIYIATTIQSDIDYMEKFALENDFVKTIYYEQDGHIILDNKCLIWDNAYNNCQEENTVYLKLDDDIVYFDETLFTDFIEYRINNRDAPLLYPVIINNLYMSWLLQEKGSYNPIIKTNIGNNWKQTYARIKQHILINKNKQLRIGDFTQDNEILCPISWGNLKYCYDLHSQFIEDITNNNIEKYYLDIQTLTYAEPVSINVCSWIGSDLHNYIKKHGKIYNDEPWLSIYLPIWSNSYNQIYGKCVVSHYAYYKQRELGLDNTDILNKYLNLEQHIL